MMLKQQFVSRRAKLERINRDFWEAFENFCDRGNDSATAQGWYKRMQEIFGQHRELRIEIETSRMLKEIPNTSLHVGSYGHWRN